MGRSPCCDENGLKKGPWTPEEDQKLVQYIQEHGLGSWRALPKLAGLNRCPKSCRLRWTNYLRPDIKRGKFSQDEEQTILHLHSILGNKWSAIASHLPGRTDNEIKNFWNTHLKKKLIQMGFDPMTHQPRTDLFSSLPQLIALANLSELMEAEHHPLDEHAVQFQAEAIQLAKLQCLQYLLQSTASITAGSSPPIGENPILLNSSQLENINAAPFSLGMGGSHLLHHPILSSTHLPDDPQVPFGFQTPLNCEMGLQGSNFAVVSQQEDSPPPTNSPWLLTSPSPNFYRPPTETEISMNTPGDDNSNICSYGGGGGTVEDDR
ncbi:hypothetical protein L1049_025519 [Liquidambar formosana]|uniref:Uncharacterized protein n=1 Tax=Liquidambar formosana TaxID=63359 RepID=A0AAP0NDA1_LIQFO